MSRLLPLAALATLLAASTALAQHSLPLTGYTDLARGQRYASSSGDHYLMHQDDGNLVVRTATGALMWSLQDVGVPPVHQATFRDGNLLLYDHRGDFVWSPLTGSNKWGSWDQDSHTHLTISSRGALRLVSDERGVVWSSDGDLTLDAAAAPDATAAPAAPAGAWRVHEGSAQRHNFGRVVPNGDNEGFLSGAEVPAPDAAGWSAVSTDGALTWSGPGGTPCRSQANYTYFETVVRPGAGEGYELEFLAVDDAARVSATAGTGTINIPEFVGLRERKTLDLTPFLEAGADNRIVVTLADVCGAGNGIRAQLRPVAASPAQVPANTPPTGEAPTANGPACGFDEGSLAHASIHGGADGFVLETERKYYGDDCAHYLTFQGDGNLVVYTADDGPVWSFYVMSNPPVWRANTRAVFTADGNLATYAGDRKTWETGPAGSGLVLWLTDDGVLQIVSMGDEGSTAWTSDETL